MVKVLPFRTAWTCLLVWIQRRLNRGYETSRWARLDLVWIKVGAEVHANITEHPNPTETRPFGNAEVIMDVATWPCTVSLWVIDAFVAPYFWKNLAGALVAKRDEDKFIDVFVVYSFGCILNATHWKPSCTCSVCSFFQDAGTGSLRNSQTWHLRTTFVLDGGWVQTASPRFATVASDTTKLMRLSILASLFCHVLSCFSSCFFSWWARESLKRHNSA